MLTPDAISAGIAYFTDQLQMTMPEKHRARFLRKKFNSFEDLRKALAAYKVFGDLGW